MIKKLFSSLRARSRSLKWAMLYALTVGLLMAVATFLLVRTAFSAYITNVYLAPEQIEAREEGFVNKLQEYVTDRDLSSSDTAELARWAKSNKYLYVLIYKDDALLFQSGDEYEEEKPEEKPGGGEVEKPDDADPDRPPTDTEGEVGSPEGKPDDEEGGGGSSPLPGITVERPSREELIKYAEENDSHLLTMKDAEVLVSMADFSEYLYYDLTGIVSLVLAALTLIVVMMLYYGRVTGRITRLARSVSETAEGDITKSITADGRDEIAKLAANVENMRASIVKNLEREKEAREANIDLITSMSHDIRTPLTVLLGYIDMMKSRNIDGEMAEYIVASERTAIRLKELSDGLFNYFLLFGGGVSDTPLVSHDAAILFDQLLSEFDLLFRERGYKIERECSPAAESAFSLYNVMTDAPEAMRVVENIFSNIGKYADKAAPVSISIDFADEKYKLKFTNRISYEASAAESNGVGLRTCRKLAERIFAGFETERAGENFSVTVELFAEKRRRENEIS